MIGSDLPQLKQIVESGFGENRSRYAKISRRTYPYLRSSYTVDTVQKLVFRNSHKSPHPCLDSIIGPPLGNGTSKEATLLYGPSSFSVRLSYKNPTFYLANRLKLDSIFAHLSQFPDFFLVPIPQEEWSAKTGSIKIAAYAPKMITLDSILESESCNFGYALHWIDCLAKGLHFLHTLGYVHRDLKIENIFIDPQGRALLGDLDYVEEGPSHHVDGSPLYLPYEVRFPASLPIPFDLLKKGDLFALGVIFLFLTFGLKDDLIDDLVTMQGMVNDNPKGGGPLWEKQRNEWLQKIKARAHVMSDLICGLLAPVDSQISIEKCLLLLQKIRGGQ